MNNAPAFEDLWESPWRISRAEPSVGVGVLADRSSRASQLAGGEHTVYVTDSLGNFEIDVPLPNVERLFVSECASGDFSGLPRLRELFTPTSRDLTGLAPEIEKLTLGWGIASVPASATLRWLWARGLDELNLARFPNLERLKIVPGSAVAAELRTVELLGRLELSLGVANLAKLSLIGSKDRLEYLQVDGGLGSVEGVERFGALRTATFVRTKVRDFSPLANSLVAELKIEHGKAAEDDFRGLGEMPALRRLHLEVSAGALERVADLHRAPMLESIDFGESALGDAVIDSLIQIHTLSRVVMLGGTKAQATRLAAARPDIEIVGGLRHAAPQALQVMCFDDEWSISGDVTSLIDAPTNYSAERKIKAALDPHIRKQLTFDTEAGMFCARATHLATIDAVAETIRRLQR